MNNDYQPNLFGFEELEPDWQEHWQDMPEYVQEDLMPLKTLYVHFDSEKDLQNFAKLVGQTIYNTTQYIWFPKADLMRVSNLSYVDEI